MHRAQLQVPTGRRLVLSTPQETHCGPALVQLSARAHIAKLGCAAGPPSSIHLIWPPSALASHLLHSCALSTEILDFALHVLSRVCQSTPRRRDVRQSWLPRPGQQVPIERAATPGGGAYGSRRSLPTCRDLHLAAGSRSRTASSRNPVTSTPAAPIPHPLQYPQVATPAPNDEP
jgi:hypothetical protein